MGISPSEFDPLADELVVDILLDHVIGQDLGVGVHLAGALGSGRPEPVLELEPDQPVLVVRCPLREAERRVDSQKPHPPAVNVAGRVLVAWVIGDLDEGVTRHAAQVAD